MSTSVKPSLSVPADRFVVDGDRIIVAMEGVEMADNDLMSPTMTYFEPPSELVALNQPCPECDGNGWLHLGEFSCMGCPKCGGSGRLVFDLKTPCDCRCHQSSIDGHLTGPCCDGDGTVTHRVWLDPDPGVVPITDDGPAAKVGDYVAVLRKMET